MADIFISYARQDSALIADLAEKLRAAGYSIWWDAHLPAGDSFRASILLELNAAKVVVVVWTKASVKSEWVISEAQRAATQDKLLPVRTTDVQPLDIPQPFDTRHTLILDESVCEMVAARIGGLAKAKLRTPDIDHAGYIDGLLRQKPLTSQELLQRGRAFMDVELYDRAIEDFSRCLGLDPGDAEAMTERGMAYHQLKRWKEALADLDAALRVRPRDSSALWLRGET